MLLVLFVKLLGGFFEILANFFFDPHAPTVFGSRDLMGKFWDIQEFLGKHLPAMFCVGFVRPAVPRRIAARTSWRVANTLKIAPLNTKPSWGLCIVFVVVCCCRCCRSRGLR